MNAPLIKRYEFCSVPILCLSMALAAGAQNAPSSERVINVRTVSQLYSAVNNAGNRGVTVRLAPGTYVLSSVYPSGAARPNQGALRMPPGMSLIGSEKRVDTNGDGVPDPVSADTPDDFTVAGTETVIDGSGLDLPFEERTDCDGQPFSAPNPVIHVGVNNTVSHLTVVAGTHVAISEPTVPVDPNGNQSMVITYTVLEASFSSFSNCGCAARRARSTLTFSHNVVHGAQFDGMLIQNFLTGNANNGHSDGPAIWAILTSNLFYNNVKALQVTGAERGTDGGSVTLYMNGNVFRNNGINFVARAAVSHPGPTIENRLTLRSEFDSFGEASENVWLEAGAGTDGSDPVRGELDAELLHSHFIRDLPDTPPEISIFGGGGLHNRAEVLIRDATVTTSAGVRTEGVFLIQNAEVPGVGTSKARLEGTRQEFIQSNQGLPAPPARFFLGQ